MEASRLFSRSISLLSRVLDLRSKNHNLIASNIANADTPEYKAFHIQMDKELQKLSGSQQKVGLHRTQADHLQPRGHRSDRIKVTSDTASEFGLRGDGNTVDIDRSMARLSENSLRYNIVAHMIQKKFNGLKSVIQGGSGGK